MADLIQIGMALMVSVTANVGSDPNLYQTATWEGPTMVEVGHCAQMAKDLNEQFDYLIAKGLNHDWQIKTATCEVFPEPAADPEDDVEIKNASFKF